MPYSDWVFALYGIGLFYLLLHLDKVKDRSSFRFCWFFYVGKGPQATTDFLNKCIGLGLLKKVGGEYHKVHIPDGAD